MGEATRQQKLFVDEFLKARKKNATQAAIRAGYSERSASSQASQLLNNPKVSRFLKEREREISEQLQEQFVFDAIEAREVMNKILNDKEARDIDKITIARDFLDRAGFKPVDKVEQSGGLSLNVTWGNEDDEG